MEFLLPITTILGIILGPLYLAFATDENDALYFLRKRQFKKKLVKNGFQNIWETMNYLLQTTESDWDDRGSHMTLRLFEKTRIVYSDFMWHEVKIYEGPRRTALFKLCFFNDEKKIGYGYDYVTKKHLTERDKFKMEQVIFHLEKIKKNLENNNIQEEKEEEEIKQKSFQEIKEENKRYLKDLIKKQNGLFKDYQENDFMMNHSEDQSYYSFEVSYQGVVYYQALCIKTTDKIEARIHHKQNKDAELFIELKTVLNEYAKKVFTHMKERSKTNDKIMEVLQDSYDLSFDGELNRQINSVKQLLVELQKDEKWLSIESIHILYETLPNDLHALYETYQSVRDKDKIKEDVKQSLLAIQEKITRYIQEAEENKYKDIQKRRKVIEKR